eukprot:12478152-Prorocentrum_lima.AAC.1
MLCGPSGRLGSPFAAWRSRWKPDCVHWALEAPQYETTPTRAMLATTQTRERLEETQRDKETKRERERERERFRIVEKDLDTIRYYHPTSRVARSTRPGRSLFHPLARSPASSLADAQLREHRLMQEVEC